MVSAGRDPIADMAVDWVALASVVSSGAVATASVLAAQRNARAQRRHESRLAFEERAWDVKRETLVELVQVARALHTDMGYGDEGVPETQARAVAVARYRLRELDARVDAYGTQLVRDLVESLTHRLRETGLPPVPENEGDPTLWSQFSREVDIEEHRIMIKRAAADVMGTARAALRGENDLAERLGSTLFWQWRGEDAGPLTKEELRYLRRAERQARRMEDS